jgi:hypothetical protein
MRSTKEIDELLKRMIPGKCRRVFELMRCLEITGGRSGNLARWRIIDIQRATGHNSDEQRLRELRNKIPGLFFVREIPHNGGTGGFYHEYQLRRDWVKYLKAWEAGR